jgi:NAD(P)-dependent dehydrogenase (short-subunit alcohol dehydrogenase family)
MFSLENKTALITGGTAGIGLVTAKRFARAGAKVVIVGRRDGGSLAEAFDGIFVRADIASEEQLALAFEKAEDAVGKLDIVMNNAGIENSGPTIDEADAEEFQRIIEINLKAVYNGLRYGPRHMRDEGSIINVSSLAALMGSHGYSQYAATKAAVVSLTKTAAIELVSRKIRVNAVCPGSIWSEMLPEDHPEVAVIEKLAPMGRVGEPEEVAALCHFLASTDASYITGQAIVVDGGVDAGFAMHTIEAMLS